MSTYLYRLARIALRRPWLMVGGWAVIILVVATMLIINPPKIANEMHINGTAAQEVIDHLADVLPQSSGGQATIAFVAPDGQRIDDRANLSVLLSAIGAVSQSNHVISPSALARAEMAKGAGSPTLSAFMAIAHDPVRASPAGAPVQLTLKGQMVPGVSISADHRVALFQFQFDQQADALPDGTVERTLDAARNALSHSDITVLPSAGMTQLPAMGGGGESIGVLVAALVLVITLGSVLAAGLPLVNALATVAVGVGGTFMFSHVVKMQSLTAVLALMIGLAVGIDYAMFIVNRHRRLIIDGLTAVDAAQRAVSTAGSAVVFAGTTVVIALVALTVVGISTLTLMALAAAATVVVSVLASLTLLPALLGLVGERICSPRARQRKSATRQRFSARWVALLLGHRILAAVAGIAITAVLALPALSMSLGLPAGGSYNRGTPQRQSYELVAQHFGAGYNGPLVVVAEPSPRQKALSSADVANTYRELSRLDGVASVNLWKVSDSAETAVFSVVASTGPTDKATAQLVRDIRAHTGPLSELHGIDLGVTGITAIGIDASRTLARAAPLYIALVVGLSVLILLVVFQSIAIPIKATVGFLLSLLATLGAVTAVFQWGWIQHLLGLSATGPVLNILPIFLTGVLYGLAMDYQVFVVSSMKEAHTHGHRADAAVTSGFGQAGRVVTAAAIIMTSVFAGFMANVDPMVKQIGFALAFGIFVDAFVVRLTVVPAVMSMLGERAWRLPRRLATLLPELDIEGAKLGRPPSGGLQPSGMS
jgi:putative drug exporter of the RND superfamily